ncbi:MAG: flagellar hook assembly protein FlgD [bacterium]
MDISSLSGSSVPYLTGQNGAQDILTSKTGAMSSSSLNKDDFLKLLLTQLQHQDPMNPLDNTEFLAQLSQFSQLEQIYNVNQNIQSMAASQNLVRDSLLTNWLGKTVKVEGSQIYLNNQDGANLSYELLDWADKVTINIYDADSQRIKKIEQFHQGEGIHTMCWDGTDSEGNKVAAGTYAFEVIAESNDESIWVTPYTVGQVCGISFSHEGEPSLQVGNQEIPLSKIIQITDQEKRIPDHERVQ